MEASIQNEQYKLYFRGKNGKQEGTCLYDLSADKGEKEDIRESHPEIAKQLKSVYDTFWADARKHMINEIPEKRERGKRSVFYEMYRTKMGEEKYKAALTMRDGRSKYFFRSKK